MKKNFYFIIFVLMLPLIVIVINTKFLKNNFLKNKKVDFTKVEDYNKINSKDWIYSFKKGETIKMPPDFDWVAISNRLFYDFLCVRIRQNLNIKPLSYDLSVMKEFNKVREEDEKSKNK